MSIICEFNEKNANSTSCPLKTIRSVFLHPTLPLLRPTSLILLYMRTVKISFIRSSTRVSRGRSSISHTGTSRLPGRIVQLSWYSYPAPAHSTTLSCAPIPAPVSLSPFNVTRGEHLLLNVLLVPLHPCLLHPALQVNPVLSNLPLFVVKCSLQKPHP